jgi:aryl-alcohol dehydrogenase-like predicted oxidoreductase
VGFTGHKSPDIHLKMLQTGFPFDAVQMPLNVFDASFHSFEQKVLPELERRGIAALGMKPLTGKADCLKKNILTVSEALRYAMSLPVATTITGMEKLDILRQNLKIAQEFSPMAAGEMEALRARCRPLAGDGCFEHYKVSLQFDNPEARLAHGFPIDPQQMEIKEMLAEAKNAGLAFPEMLQ